MHCLLVTDIVKIQNRLLTLFGLTRYLAALRAVAVPSRGLVLPALVVGAVLLAAPLRAEFVYVSNSDDATVSGYSVGSGGNLTTIAASPFATGRTPDSLAVYPAGNFLYVLNLLDKSVSGYSIGSTGALTPVRARLLQ